MADTRVLAVLGAGPKGMAIAAKAKVLAELGLGNVQVVIIEQRAVAADWQGNSGWTDGEPHLGTWPEKDIGFPYRSVYGLPADAAMQAYSWQMFLIHQREFSDWVDRGRPQPLHRQWAAYLRWCYDQIAPQLIHGRLTAIVPQGSDLQLTVERDGQAETLRADGLVITGPGASLHIPTIACDNEDCILDGRTFWFKRPIFDQLPAGRIAVIGGGETAAAIATALQANYNLTIDIITRHGVIYTRGESFYESRLYSQPDLWTSIDIDERREFINRTDRGVFSVAALRQLDQALNVHVIAGTALSAETLPTSARLTLDREGTVEVREYDKVIVAIGFDPYTALNYLPEAARPTLSRREIEQQVDDYLRIPGLNLHMPMLAAWAQGPGFPNLSTLGTLADRILSPVRASDFVSLTL